MKSKTIYLIAGIFFIAAAGYALDSWNEFENGAVAPGQPLTATMLTTIYHNIRNLTDIMHSEGDVLKVQGRIKASDPVDNDDIATKGWVEANALTPEVNIYDTIGIDGAISADTYFANGGANHFCKKIIVDVNGVVTTYNINQGLQCSSGHICMNGLCIPGSAQVYSMPTHTATVQLPQYTPITSGALELRAVGNTLTKFCEEHGYDSYEVLDKRYEYRSGVTWYLPSDEWGAYFDGFYDYRIYSLACHDIN